MNSNWEGFTLKKSGKPNPTYPPLLFDSTFFVIEDEETKPVAMPIPIPAHFPKNSRFLGMFTQFKRFQEGGNESCHPTYTAFYEGKKFYIKFNLDTGIKEEQKHYLINLPPELDQLPLASKTALFLKAEILSQLEVACWRWYRIAASAIVSKAVHPCFAYDEQEKTYRFVAVASEEIPGFKANRFDPLQHEDLHIDFLFDDFIKKRPEIIENLAELSPLLERLSDIHDTYMDSLWNKTKQAYNSLHDYAYGTTKSAVTLKPIIDHLISKNDINTIDAYQLLPRLIERQKELKNKSTKNKKNQLEEELLPKIIENISPDIKRLEEIDKTVETLFTNREKILLSLNKNVTDDDIITTNFLNQTISISIKELKNHRLIDKINPNTFVSDLTNNKSFSIKIKDLQNYRIKKGLAEGLTQSYINAENDYHNKNGSKKGKRIDFDMSEWPFFSNFKEVNYIEWIKENATWLMGHTNKFQFTSKDFNSFPNLQEDKRRYWPTEASRFSPVSQSRYVIPFFENLYTSKDNSIFKLLENDPVFIFHCYKKFLQNILIPENLYRKSIELDIRYDLFYNDPHHYAAKKNLIDEVVIYKLNRIQQLKNLLYKEPQFHHFLAKNGDYAFSLIKESFENDKKDPELNDLINLDEIQKEYAKVLVATGVKKEFQSERHQEQKKSSVHRMGPIF